MKRHQSSWSWSFADIDEENNGRGYKLQGLREVDDVGFEVASRPREEGGRSPEILG